MGNGHDEILAVAAGPLHGTLRMTGYELPDDLSYDDWAAEGPTLVTMARASMWWVGDWLAYGEHHYGEKYAQAVEATGLAVQTLKNAQWVADRIPQRDRIADVPFSHHRAVASLDPEPRRELLREAATEGLTEFEVRTRVREVKAENAEPDPEPPDESPASRSLAEILDDARVRLDRALDVRDWDDVVAARQFVAEAGELCGGLGAPA